MVKHSGLNLHLIALIPTDAKTPSKTAFFFAFAAIYIIWGSTYLGIRVAVETMPPFLMAGFRFLISGTVLFTIMQLRGAPWPTLLQWRDNAIVGGCLLLGGNGIVSWAEQKVPSGLTTLILGASPISMVLLDWVRPGGKRPTLGLWIGIALGLTGLIILLGPGAIPSGSRPPLSRVVALIAASILWWIGSLYSKHSKNGAMPMNAASIQMLAGSGMMLLTGLLTHEAPLLKLQLISFHSWIAFAYLIFIGSLVAYPVYVWLLTHTTPVRLSTYAYVNPFVAVFLGWAILNEPVTPRIFLAAIIIIAAVAILTIHRYKTASKS
jgi:hypothetical protein